MRRVFVVIGIWFVIVGGVTAAFGDPVTVKVKGEPTAVVAGQPYVVNLLVTKYGRAVHGAKPLVTVSYPGGRVSFRATEHGHDGIYSARVRVPMPGRWRYEVHLGERVVSKRTYKVTMP
jgi:YtkA-like